MYYLKLIRGLRGINYCVSSLFSNKIQLHGLSTINYELWNQENILQKTFLNTDLDKTAISSIINGKRKELSFATVLLESRRISDLISSAIGKNISFLKVLIKVFSNICILGNQSNKKISFLGSGASSVIAQFAIWMSYHTAVPLSHLHPDELIEYFITDSETELIIVTEQYETKMRPIAEKLRRPILVVELTSHDELDKGTKIDDLKKNLQNKVSASTDPAMLMY